MTNAQPFISVVTPVYNGDAFIAECIESVLAQSYTNFEYIILNNHSTDRTGEIAADYARRDERITVLTTDRLLPIMENWNHAVRQISPASEYCKIVHADDWLLPECLTAMLEVATAHPSAGIVSAYAQWGASIGCTGMPHPDTLIPGRELARLVLLKKTYPFLSPSCLLIRSDLIRERDPFYPGTDLHADVQVLYELLKTCDFGFVHQVLTYIRKHEDSETATQAAPLNTLINQNLNLLIRYGPEFLQPDEHRGRVEDALARYYRFLAKNLLADRDQAFWDYHRAGLQSLGMPLSRFRLRIMWMLVLGNRVLKKVSKKISFAPK